MKTGGRPFGTPLPEPTSADIEGLTHKIAARLTAVIERAGADAGDTDAALERTAAAIRVALAAALEPPLPKLGLEWLDPPAPRPPSRPAALPP